MGEWMYRSHFSWYRHYLDVSGQVHAPPALPRGKSLRYPLNRLGGPQSRSGRRGEERILDPTGTRISNPRSFSPWPVVIPTTLSRLLFILIIIIIIIMTPTEETTIKTTILLILQTNQSMNSRLRLYRFSSNKQQKLALILKEFSRLWNFNSVQEISRFLGKRCYFDVHG
jgi:hypothetical protein